MKLHIVGSKTRMPINWFGGPPRQGHTAFSSQHDEKDESKPSAVCKVSVATEPWASDQRLVASSTAPSVRPDSAGVCLQRIKANLTQALFYLPYCNASRNFHWNARFHPPKIR